MFYHRLFIAKLYHRRGSSDATSCQNITGRNLKDLSLEIVLLQIVNVKIVHTTMCPKVSVSLIKKHILFIQGKIHASKSF